jgi:hypothetical protein
MSNLFSPENSVNSHLAANSTSYPGNVTSSCAYSNLSQCPSDNNATHPTRGILA